MSSNDRNLIIIDFKNSNNTRYRIVPLCNLLHSMRLISVMDLTLNEIDIENGCVEQIVNAPDEEVDK